MLYIWLGVICALIMIEVISKNYTAICFAISAMFSLISINNTTQNYIIQVVIFLLGGIALMVFVRPNVLNMIEDKKKKKNPLLEKPLNEVKINKNEIKSDEKIKNSKKLSNKKPTKKKKTKKKNANK